jgi:hypothetical protein
MYDIKMSVINGTHRWKERKNKEFLAPEMCKERLETIQGGSDVLISPEDRQLCMLWPSGIC